jgi:hypothetical protein
MQTVNNVRPARTPMDIPTTMGTLAPFASGVGLGEALEVGELGASIELVGDAGSVGVEVGDAGKDVAVLSVVEESCIVVDELVLLDSEEEVEVEESSSSSAGLLVLLVAVENLLLPVLVSFSSSEVNVLSRLSVDCD